jgi:hypothetical protein
MLAGELPIPDPGENWTAWPDWMTRAGVRLSDVDEHAIRMRRASSATTT